VPTVAAGSADAVSHELEGTGKLGGLAPADLRSAYNLPETGGAGQTVAIVDAYNDPHAESDLAVYRSTYGLPACTEANGCFKKVNQNGETTNYPVGEPSWGIEISLDVDTVSAACSQCHILLVEANNASTNDLLAAEDRAATMGATEISNSWDGEESAEDPVNDSHFNHPGIPITVASGDSGYVGQPKWPASSPYVISVGGTKLVKALGSRGWSEEVWGFGVGGAKGDGTGSGCSVYEQKPRWQSDKACAHRMVGDASADASTESPLSVYDTFELAGWYNSGGTSAGAPFLAGVEALSSRAARSLGAEAFYLAGSEGALFDVTHGSNGKCTPPIEDEYFCSGLVGYDGPTGWGTPNGPFMAPAATTEPASAVSETGATLHGTVNPNGAATTYYFEYGPTTSYGTSSGGSAGSARGNVFVSRAITGLAPGTYHFRVVASSWAGTTYGADRTFAQPPSYSGSFGSFGTGAGQLREPTDLATDSSGNIWVADWQDSRLEEYNSTGGFVRSVGSYGSGAGQFQGVSGVASNFGEDHVWASDCGNERIDRFSLSSGAFEQAYGSKGSGNGQFNCPDGIADDFYNQSVYVADRGNHRIEELSKEGQYLRSFSKPEEKEGPSDVAIDLYVTGNVWVTYGAEAKVAEFTPEGSLIRVWGVKGTAPGQIEDAYRLRVGPEGDVWLAEWRNNRVQVFTPNGEYVYGFGGKGSGEGQFLHARGIDFNGSGSTAYVLDSGEWWENTGNARVEKWTLK